DSKTVRAEGGDKLEKHLLLTRYDALRANRGQMMKVEDVLEILAIPLLGIVAESPDVLTASNLGAPLCPGGAQAVGGARHRLGHGGPAGRLHEPAVRQAEGGVSFLSFFNRN